MAKAGCKADFLPTVVLRNEAVQQVRLDAPPSLGINFAEKMQPVVIHNAALHFSTTQRPAFHDKRQHPRLRHGAPDEVRDIPRGRGRNAGPLRLQFRPNGLAFARIAQVLPKKMAKRAVDRSRLRRLIRESFRLRQAAWSGYDCVFRLREAFERDRDYARLAAALLDPGP